MSLECVCIKIFSSFVLGFFFHLYSNSVFESYYSVVMKTPPQGINCDRVIRNSTCEGDSKHNTLQILF